MLTSTNYFHETATYLTHAQWRHIIPIQPSKKAVSLSNKSTEGALTSFAIPTDSLSLNNLLHIFMLCKNYSLPQKKLISMRRRVHRRVWCGCFSNSAGLFVQGFLCMLHCYLHSSYEAWNDEILIQKQGVYIGSCLAPILSDICLAHHNKNLSRTLSEHRLVKVVRYIDD